MSTAKSFVVPPGGGIHHASPAPGRFFDLKLLSGETNGSIMLFEETLPAGTSSLYHLHHESDEVAWVLEGELTFKVGDEVTSGGPGTCAFMPRNMPHAWKNTGGTIGRALFLYTPAMAGGYIEEMADRGSPKTAAERAAFCERYRWEILGPNPL